MEKKTIIKSFAYPLAAYAVITTGAIAIQAEENTTETESAEASEISETAQQETSTDASIDETEESIALMSISQEEANALSQIYDTNTAQEITDIINANSSFVIHGGDYTSKGNIFNFVNKIIYVNGQVNVTNFNLTNSTVEGVTDRDTDRINVTFTNGNAVAFSGTENNVNDVTLNVSGTGSQFLVNWQSETLNFNNAALYANNNSNGNGFLSNSGSKYFNGTNTIFEFNNNGNGLSGFNLTENYSVTDVIVTIVGGSFSASGNDLNGIQSSHARHDVFTFTNTDVKVDKNGSNQGSGQGDGLSYGYYTFKSTDGTLHTLSASDNVGNGIGGGAYKPFTFLWIIRSSTTALDIDGYIVDANNNGSFGIAVGSLNDGQITSSIKNSTVTTNNNNVGLYYYNKVTIENSDITSNENKNGASYRYLISEDGNGLIFDGGATIDGSSSITVLNNNYSGVITRENVTFEDGASVIIQHNGVQSAKNGGGIFNTGTLVLPSNALINNNVASVSGDDIYSTGTLTIQEVVKDDLEEEYDNDCNDAINNWLEDITDSRWDAHHVDSLYVRVVQAGTYEGTIGIKAAHNLPILVKTTGETYVYDGQEHVGTIAVIADPNEDPTIQAVVTSLLNQLSYSAYSTGSATHVLDDGTLVGSFHFDDEEIADNFEIRYENGKVVILPATITIKTESATKIYDGKALTADGSISGLVNGETATFTITGSQTNVGSSQNTYLFDFDGTALESDYIVEASLGTLTVTEKDDEPETPKEEKDITEQKSNVSVDQQPVVSNGVQTSAMMSIQPLLTTLTLSGIGTVLLRKKKED